MNTTTRATFATVADADVFASHKTWQAKHQARCARWSARTEQHNVDTAKFWVRMGEFWTRFNGDRSRVEFAQQQFNDHLARVMRTTDRATVDF